MPHRELLRDFGAARRFTPLPMSGEFAQHRIISRNISKTARDARGILI